MTLSLYLLRHGETASSATGGYCGITDIDLTPEGYEMANDFAEAFQHHPFKGIYASPLKRTRMTAGPIAERLGILPEFRPGLRETEFGAWEGMSAEDVKRTYPDDYLRWTTDAGWNRPTQGERGIDVARRALDVLDEIQQTHRSGDVLIVSHKATIRILICAVLGIDIGGYRDRIGISVASLSIINFELHGPRLEQLGDRSHLRPELRARTGT
jgi:broad specificity phosphatase PhoE